MVSLVETEKSSTNFKPLITNEDQGNEVFLCGGGLTISLGELELAGDVDGAQALKAFYCRN